MKMMNNDMEIVVFDAQDVIVTSGWYGVNMFAKYSVVNDYNTQYTELPALQAGTTGSSGYGYFYNQAHDEQIEINQAWAFDKYNDPMWNEDYINVKGALGDNSVFHEYRQAKTAQDIFDWITANYMGQ